MGGRPGGPAEPATAPMLAYKPAMERLDYEVAALREHHVLLQSVETAIALNLPPAIALPEEVPYGRSLRIRDTDQHREIYQTCIRPPPNKTIYHRELPTSYRSHSAGPLPSNWSSGSGSDSGASSKRPGSLFGRTVRCISSKLCHQNPTENEAEGKQTVPSIRLTPSEASPVAPSKKVPSEMLPMELPQSYSRVPERAPLSVVVPSYRSRRLSAFSKKASSNLASVPTVQCVTSIDFTGRTQGASSEIYQVPRSCVEELNRSQSNGSACDKRISDSKGRSTIRR